MFDNIGDAFESNAVSEDINYNRSMIVPDDESAIGTHSFYIKFTLHGGHVVWSSQYTLQVTCTPNSDYVAFTFPAGKSYQQNIAVGTNDYFHLPTMASTSSECSFNNFRITDQNTTTGVDSTMLDYLVQGGLPTAKPKNNMVQMLYNFYIEITNTEGEIIFTPLFQLSVGCT